MIKEKILTKKDKITNSSQIKNQEDDKFARCKILFSDLKRLYNNQIENFETFDQIEDKFLQNRTKLIECVYILRSISESKMFEDQLDDPSSTLFLRKTK